MYERLWVKNHSPWKRIWSMNVKVLPFSFIPTLRGCTNSNNPIHGTVKNWREDKVTRWQSIVSSILPQCYRCHIQHAQAQQREGGIHKLPTILLIIICWTCATVLKNQDKRASCPKVLTTQDIQVKVGESSSGCGYSMTRKASGFLRGWAPIWSKNEKLGWKMSKRHGGRAFTH